MQLPAAKDGQLPEPFQPAKIIARVGNLPILAGDVLPMVNQALLPYMDRMTASQIEQQRERLMKDALKGVPPEKLAEVLELLKRK